MNSQTRILSDGELLTLFAGGDRSAAMTLMNRHGSRVFNQAFRMLGDKAEAEDVTQEAMLRLWKIAPQWEEGAAQVSTWLYRVTANLCTDRLRKSGRGVGMDEIDEPADPAPSAVQNMQQGAREVALRAALADLPDRQAQAIALRHFEGLANPTIAQIMQVNLRGVESLIARGKRGLIAALSARKEELGFDDE